MSLKIDKAKEELKEKSYLEIQKSTAWTWASRAAVSYDLAIDEKDLSRKVAVFQVAEEYHHEAIEHAALYEDGGDGYDYEQGAYALVAFAWNEGRGELTIGARQGNFRGLVPRRRYHLVFVSNLGRKTKTIDYIGEKMVVSAA